MSRRQARVWALQVLYAKEMNPESEDVSSESVGKLSDRDQDFVVAVIGYIERNFAYIDENIQNHLKKWSLKELNVVDKNIIRMGISEFELSSKHEDDKRIVINEAVELAKKYGGEDSHKLINAVLEHTLEVRNG